MTLKTLDIILDAYPYYITLEVHVVGLILFEDMCIWETSNKSEIQFTLSPTWVFFESTIQTLNLFPNIQFNNIEIAMPPKTLLLYAIDLKLNPCLSIFLRNNIVSWKPPLGRMSTMWNDWCNNCLEHKVAHYVITWWCIKMLATL